MDKEHKKSATVSFTVRTMPDGTYSRETSEEIPLCPQCNRLVTEHTKDEMRACLQRQRAEWVKRNVIEAQ